MEIPSRMVLVFFCLLDLGLMVGNRVILPIPILNLVARKRALISKISLLEFNHCGCNIGVIDVKRSSNSMVGKFFWVNDEHRYGGPVIGRWKTPSTLIP